MSAQCMALVRDDCLVPTKDAPELGYIRESTDKQYVPDVYYKVSESALGSFIIRQLDQELVCYTLMLTVTCPWTGP